MIMNFLHFILLSFTGTVTIKILLLVIVSAVIGFIIAWRYYQFIYKKKIKGLKSERNELDNRINKKLNEIELYLKKTDEFQQIPVEPGLNDERNILINKRTGQKQYEKERALIRKTQRRRILNYKRVLERLRKYKKMD